MNNTNLDVAVETIVVKYTLQYKDFFGKIVIKKCVSQNANIFNMSLDEAFSANVLAFKADFNFRKTSFRANFGTWPLKYKYRYELDLKNQKGEKFTLITNSDEINSYKRRFLITYLIKNLLLFLIKIYYNFVKRYNINIENKQK